MEINTAADMNKNTSFPVWYTKNGISEIAFAAEYLEKHPMRCIGGKFYTPDGIIDSEEELRADIYRLLEPHISRGASKLVGRILDTMRLKAQYPSPPIDWSGNTIHVGNGTYHLEHGFREEKEYCINRLPVDFNPEAPLPEVWLAFLAELLEEKDIDTLQEFMGYCLVPVTRAQKMLLIIGNGGEGKSRIGLVLRALLGDSMNIGNLRKLETNQFARADLEYRLAMVDDDMQMDALPSTNTIKTLVTAEDKMDVERKGVQSYQSRLYCRLIGFGNTSLSSLHDRSNGFFRRQILLRAKPRPHDRTDAADLIDLLLTEKEGIFLWCLSGLRRLRKNGYRFTVSESARQNLLESMKESNNILEFMRSEGYIEYNLEWCATSKQLCRAYGKWCDDNAMTPLADRTLISYLKDNQHRYPIRYTNSIRFGNAEVRGFQGLRVCT